MMMTILMKIVFDPINIHNPRDIRIHTKSLKVIQTLIMMMQLILEKVLKDQAKLKIRIAKGKNQIKMTLMMI